MQASLDRVVVLAFDDDVARAISRPVADGTNRLKDGEDRIGEVLLDHHVAPSYWPRRGVWRSSCARCLLDDNQLVAFD